MIARIWTMPPLLSRPGAGPPAWWRWTDMNATAEKFGYPDSLIKEYQHCLVLARP